jgi:hypothetical protein
MKQSSLIYDALIDSPHKLLVSSSQHSQNMQISPRAAAAAAHFHTAKYSRKLHVREYQFRYKNISFYHHHHRHHHGTAAAIDLLDECIYSNDILLCHSAGFHGNDGNQLSLQFQSSIFNCSDAEGERDGKKKKGKYNGGKLNQHNDSRKSEFIGRNVH